MAKVVLPSSRQQEAWRLMLDLLLSHRGQMLSIAQEFGLAPQQAFALQHLQPDEPIKLSDLAHALRCDNSSVTGIADRLGKGGRAGRRGPPPGRLEKAGLADLRAHPTDRLVKTLALTERGVVIRNLYKERIGTAPEAVQNLT